MRFIRTNRDLFMWATIVLWLVSYVAVSITFGIKATIIVNDVFFIGILIAIFLDRDNGGNNNFNRWLRGEI